MQIFLDVKCYAQERNKNKDFKELQVPGLVAPHAYIFMMRGYI